MKVSNVTRFRAAAGIVLFAALALTTVCRAQEIRLRVGDRLMLAVPQRKEMERQLVISEGGAVNIPTIGRIVIEGMTVNEAEVTLLRRIQDIYPGIGEIALSLLGEEARRTIYVHGEVLNPGRYEFGATPSVWEAVREAGGATAGASLEAVRIIRADDDGLKTEIVNLQSAIDSGDFASLPELKPGDTIIVPERSVPYQGSGSVKVIGAVVNPAPYLLRENRSLVDAILAAGGPAPNANLGKVKIIRRIPEGGTLALQVDFNKYLDEGDMRHNPEIRPNDTVSVPRYSSYLRTMFTDPRFLLGLVTAAATITAVVVR
ncbi:MAG TPA: SLBB domain-containing protein [Patescibacteria group bacterium]|nr:SLBB domain-containing protein [Patescibacteria group bacterium]